MLRILIADDHDLLRKGVRDVIEGHVGWEVCGEASDGQQALEIALREKPDVAVLDVSLPIMNGVDLLVRLRQDPCLRDIPVIAMTAANDRMVGVKVDGPVLHKPIDLTLLSQMLAQYYPFSQHPAETGSEAPR